MRTYSDSRWKQGTDMVFRPTGTCTVCGKEYENGNVFASSYCSECAAKVRKEKTKERVRKFREKQKCLLPGTIKSAGGTCPSE